MTPSNDVPDLRWFVLAKEARVIVSVILFKEAVAV